MYFNPNILDNFVYLFQNEIFFSQVQKIDTKFYERPPLNKEIRPPVFIISNLRFI